VGNNGLCLIFFNFRVR